MLVRRDHPARRLSDLATARWAVNDDRSLSGYWCVVNAVGASASFVVSGGHHHSVSMVATGEVDAAAIDANVLSRLHVPDLRVVHTFGPHPVQPLVAHPSVPKPQVAQVAAALLGDADFTRWGVSQFVPVSEAHYPEEGGPGNYLCPGWLIRRAAASCSVGSSW